MKLLSSLVNPKNTRYVIFYSALLVGILATVLLKSSGMIQLATLQVTMLHFEGFTSLFMLVRNEEVGNAFVTHISKLQVLRGRSHLQ